MRLPVPRHWQPRTSRTFKFRAAPAAEPAGGHVFKFATVTGSGATGRLTRSHGASATVTAVVRRRPGARSRCQWSQSAPCRRYLNDYAGPGGRASDRRRDQTWPGRSGGCRPVTERRLTPSRSRHSESGGGWQHHIMTRMIMTDFKLIKTDRYHATDRRPRPPAVTVTVLELRLVLKLPP